MRSSVRVNAQPDLSVLSSEVPMKSGSSLYPDLKTFPSKDFSSSYSYASSFAFPSAPPSSASEDRSQQILVCYLPEHTSEGVYSCTQEKGGDKLIFTTDPRSAIVPAGAIIDSIEFFGFNGFVTKDVFSIGLGQLNTDITFPLIQDADETIANERVGGCRDFFSFDRDGKNVRNIVLCDSNINVMLSSPVTQGGLQIVIRYHMKII
jgi:hypothetical protein